jgi:hypothetical protein
MKYKQVPISAAKELAKKYDKQEVIILSVDREFDKVHITTYGINPHYCHNAKVTGEFLAEILGLDKLGYHDLVEKIKEVYLEKHSPKK